MVLLRVAAAVRGNRTVINFVVDSAAFCRQSDSGSAESCAVQMFALPSVVRIAVQLPFSMRTIKMRLRTLVAVLAAALSSEAFCQSNNTRVRETFFRDGWMSNKPIDDASFAALTADLRPLRIIPTNAVRCDRVEPECTAPIFVRQLTKASNGRWDCVVLIPKQISTEGYFQNRAAENLQDIGWSLSKAGDYQGPTLKNGWKVEFRFASIVDPDGPEGSVSGIEWLENFDEPPASPVVPAFDLQASSTPTLEKWRYRKGKEVFQQTGSVPLIKVFHYNVNIDVWATKALKPDRRLGSCDPLDPVVVNRN